MQLECRRRRSSSTRPLIIQVINEPGARRGAAAENTLPQFGYTGLDLVSPHHPSGGWRRPLLLQNCCCAAKKNRSVTVEHGCQTLTKRHHTLSDGLHPGHPPPPSLSKLRSAMAMCRLRLSASTRPFLPANPATVELKSPPARLLSHRPHTHFPVRLPFSSRMHGRTSLCHSPHQWLH